LRSGIARISNRVARRDATDWHDGQISRASTCSGALSSPLCKNILIYRNSKSPLYPSPSRLTLGALAIVTDAGRDAVDAAALLTNSANADGKVVWS
jgi:hypothetical protein